MISQDRKGFFAWPRLVILLVLALALIAFAWVVHSESWLDMSGQATNSLSANLQVEVLRDPSGKMTLEDILANRSDSFGPLPSSELSLGYTSDAAWLRVTITGYARQLALLSISPSYIDCADLYIASQDPAGESGDFAHYAIGDHRPLLVNAYSALDTVIPVELFPERPTIAYIRVASSASPVKLSVTINSLADHTLSITCKSLVYGIWFGGMLILMVIQLVFYYFDRKLYYPLLSLTTLASMLVYARYTGVSRLFLFSDGGMANDIFQGTTFWLLIFSTSLAHSRILDLRRQSSWMYWTFNLGAAIAVVGMMIAAHWPSMILVPFGSCIMVALATLAMIQSLRSTNDNGLATRLRAAAFVIPWLGLIPTLAQGLGALPLPEWTASAYMISALLQTLLLTGALGVRLRTAERVNRLMSEGALVAARAAERQAQALVEERTRELAEAKRVAEDALQAELELQQRQVRFMEVISHQYRTPLAAIRSNIDSIGISLPQEDKDNRNRLERVRRAIVRLVEVLEVNLERSRLQGPTFEPHFKRTNLAALASAAATRCRDLLNGGSRFIVEIAPEAEATSIMADSDMVRLAIVNLLENAAKFSAAAGSAEIKLSCTVESGMGMIAVSDNGIGIPSDEIEKVQHRLVRASNAHNIEGSGLGLSLVQRIVAAHNGDLRIESTIGLGTKVTMRLPTLTDAVKEQS